MENRYENLGSEWLDMKTGELFDEDPNIILIPDEEEDEKALYAFGLGATITTAYLYCLTA